MSLALRWSAAPAAALLLVLACAPAAPAAPARADLTVARLAALSQTATAGSTVQASLTVRNRGRRTAPRSVTRLVLSKDRRAATGDRVLVSLTTPAVRAGRSRTLRATAKLPLKLRTGVRYRLIACVDATRKVRERSDRNNCRVAGHRTLIVARPAAKPTAPAPPAAPAAPAARTPRLALHVDDGYDSGYLQDAAGNGAAPGDTITTTVRLANGVAGQAGYAREAVPAQPAVSGTDTTLNFGAGTDDATAPVALPFAFPFAGVPYTDAAASTNGWLAFGGPAWDYYDDNQTGDFRGVPAVVGELYRGLMPLWSDLSIAQGGGLTTPGSVRRIVAADGTVALRWDVRYLSGGRATSFQAVLFPDGRVRYDYLGTSAGAENLGNKTIVGLSAGTGTPDLFAQDVLSPPSSSVLYTPRAVDTPTAPAGTLRVTLPRLSTFVSAPDGCAVTTAPTATRAGAVDCAIGALAAGESAIRAVAWTLGTVPGTAGPENTDESARWTAGDASAQDADTLGLAAAMPSSTAITAALGFGPTPTAAVPFDVTLTTTSGSLVHPVLEVDVPAGLEVVAAPAALLCDAPPAAGAAGTLTCRPRNGGGAADASGTFTVRAAVAGDYAVTARVGADNGAAQATATQTVTVAP